MNGKHLVFFVLGLFSGAGLTYLYFSKKKDEEVSAAVEATRQSFIDKGNKAAEAKKQYNGDSMSDKDLMSASKRFDDMMELKKEHERQVKENGDKNFVDYTAAFHQTPEVKVSDKALEANAAVNERIANVNEQILNEPGRAFLTDLESYEDTCLEHDKVQMTYFIKDDTLIDEAGDIADLDYYISRQNLDEFMNNSYDPDENDTLYIINPSNSVDVECQIVDDVSHDPRMDE